MISRANTESIRPKQTNLIIFNPCLRSLFFLHLPCSPSSLVHQKAQLQREGQRPYVLAEEDIQIHLDHPLTNHFVDHTTKQRYPTATAQ